VSYLWPALASSGPSILGFCQIPG